MKNITAITILSALMIVFLWSCEKDILTSNEQKVTLRAPGGNGNGNGNGGGGGNSGTDLEVCLTSGNNDCSNYPYACNTVPGFFLGNSYFAEFYSGELQVFLSESGITLMNTKIIVKTTKIKGKKYIDRIRLLGQEGPGTNVHKTDFQMIDPPVKINSDGFELCMNFCDLPVYEFDGPASDDMIDSDPRGWVSLGAILYQEEGTGCPVCP